MTPGRWGLVAAQAAILLLLIWGWQYLATNSNVRRIPYSEFKDLVAKHEASDVVIGQEEITGKAKVSPPKASSSPAPSPSASPPPAARSSHPTSPALPKGAFWFRTGRLEDPKLVEQLQAAGVTYSAKEPGFISQLLGSWLLPVGIMVLVWLWISRRATGAIGQGVLGFGKNRARIVADKETGITFADVAGCDEAKFELEEVVDFLKHPARYKALGARIPKGALLVGPPGTGKTLLARAVAGEAHVPFFFISGSEFVEMFVGVGAARVRDLFVQAKSKAPCIIFIDELDAIGRQRGVDLAIGGHDEREQTLNQLLVELDGFDPNVGVIILEPVRKETIFR